MARSPPNVLGQICMSCLARNALAIGASSQVTMPGGLTYPTTSVGGGPTRMSSDYFGEILWTNIPFTQTRTPGLQIAPKLVPFGQTG